jgi:hypothetical protein
MVHLPESSILAGHDDDRCIASEPETIGLHRVARDASLAIDDLAREFEGTRKARRAALDETGHDIRRRSARWPPLRQGRRSARRRLCASPLPACASAPRRAWTTPNPGVPCSFFDEWPLLVGDGHSGNEIASPASPSRPRGSTRPGLEALKDFIERSDK